MIHFLKVSLASECNEKITERFEFPNCSMFNYRTFIVKIRFEYNFELSEKKNKKKNVKAKDI